MRDAVKPLVKDKGKTAIICGNQMTTPVSDLVLDVTATGSGNVMTNSKKSRLCFQVGDSGTLWTYTLTACETGGSCSLSRTVGASAHAYCASGGNWGCQRCKDGAYESRPLAECNTAAGE